VFHGGSQQNLHHWHVYSSVPHVNRGDTPVRGWVHLKVAIQSVLFLVWQVTQIFSSAQFHISLGSFKMP